MRTDQLDYFHRRAREERERAAICTDSSVALTHRRMADEYERRTREMQTGLMVVRDS